MLVALARNEVVFRIDFCRKPSISEFWIKLQLPTTAPPATTTAPPATTFGSSQVFSVCVCVCHH